MASSESKDTQVSPKISKMCMFISAICMGTVGLLVTLLGNYPIYTIVLLRGIFGTFFLTFFMIKGHSFSKEFLKESINLHWKLLLISGILYPIVIYLYFLNISISNYAIAAFLLYTSGIFVLIFIVVTKEERVSRVNIVSFILAIIGVSVIMEPWNGEGMTSGIIYGLLSGLMLGIFIFYKKKMYNKRIKEKQKLQAKGDFDMFLAWCSTLSIILLFLPFGISDLTKLTLIELIFCFILGFFPTALAFFLYNVGLKNDKGGNIIILSYFEPIMATIITIIFLKILSVYTIIGGALIIMANIIVLKYSGRDTDL